MASGIDIPTDAGRVIGQVRDAKLDFVARYYHNPTSHWPTPTASEARLISSVGMKVVVVWEAASTTSGYFSRLSGVDDSTSVHRQVHAVGQPAGSSIYFAIDYDALGQDNVGPIDEYFRAIAAGFAAAGGDAPDYPVGVYGSGAVCEAPSGSGLAEYTWVAVSRDWTGYSAFTTWNIRQVPALASLSFGHDSDEAKDDYGGFQVA